MAATHLPTDFKDFLKLLNLKKVKYLLIGGYAVGYHGYPRATVDMDIWISVDYENARKIVNVIGEFGFKNSGLTVETFTKLKKVVRMGLPPIRIKIISEIDGTKFEECYKHRIVDKIDGIKINIIDLESLKRNKKASGRLKDLTDFENLP
jgi:hypothetical protein